MGIVGQKSGSCIIGDSSTFSTFKFCLNARKMSPKAEKVATYSKYSRLTIKFFSYFYSSVLFAKNIQKQHKVIKKTNVSLEAYQRNIVNLKCSSKIPYPHFSKPSFVYSATNSKLLLNI